MPISRTSFCGVLKLDQKGAVATGPELFDDELDSIKSMPERDHTCVKGEARWYQCFGVEAP